MEEAVRSWSAALRTAVGQKIGGEAADLLTKCPLSTLNGGGPPLLSSNTLLLATDGHELSEVAYFVAEASQAATMSNRLRYYLCAFDAFQAFHTAPRPVPPVGWDTAILVTLVQRIGRLAASLTAAEAAGLSAEDESDQSAARGSGASVGSRLDDEDMGAIVRTWRRLFLELKELDPDYPNAKSRRRGALSVLNGLLGILMLCGNTHQCRIILRSVEELEADARNDPAKGVLGPCGHMGAEVVRFDYVCGRIRLYDRDFRGAFVAFRNAFGRLAPMTASVHPEVARNKQRVAFYWAVAGLGLGLGVPEHVRAVDSIINEIFSALQNALEAGSEAMFDAVLERHGVLLRRRAVYMLILSLRPRCLVGALRRVHAAISTLKGDPSRIDLRLLSDVTEALNSAVAGHPKPSANEAVAAVLHPTTAEPASAVEMLGVRVAQLMAGGLVKGYVALDAQTIVLSKKDPFPPAVAPN